MRLAPSIFYKPGAPVVVTPPVTPGATLTDASGNVLTDGSGNPLTAG